MSASQDGQNGPPQAPAPPKVIRYEIEYHPGTGAVFVRGPIDNRFATYGILELAKEAVFKHGLEAAYGISPRKVATVQRPGIVLPQ